MDQNKAPLADAVRKFRDQSRLSLHIPGHKGYLAELAELVGKEALGCDLTEIYGMDDFHKPESVIREAQELAAECFGAEQTFFLPNSTSSGLMAAVAAAAGEGEGILVASDCHKSVINGIILSGAMPVYINAAIDEKHLFTAGVSAESVRSAFEKNRGARGIVLTHPSFYGTYSDIKEIVNIAHSFGAVVIADEAHGAQIRFTGQEGIVSALEAGADVSVQSTHKMLGSLTQSAMLHVQGDLADREKISFYISLLTSTSPSYLLMASLDEIRRFTALEGSRKWKELMRLRAACAGRLSTVSSLDIVDTFKNADGKVLNIEASRIIINTERSGFSGYEFYERLAEEGIDAEFADLFNVLFLFGTGTESGDADALCSAVKRICGDRGDAPGLSDRSRRIKGLALRMAEIKCPSEMSPGKAAMSGTRILDMDSAIGQVSARNIAVYPPGIPMVHAGEIFTAEAAEAIREGYSFGMHFHGLIDDGGILKVTAADDGSSKMLFNCIF